MKILILADSSNTHTKRWVQALSKSGHNICLFSLTNGNDNDYYNISNIRLVASNTNIGNTISSKIRYLGTLRKLNRIIKEFKPDILHAHYASSYGLLGALSRHQCPYIISVWGSDVYEFPNITPFGKYILKYNLSKADYILSTSHVMAEETRKYTSKPISITPFGVDTNLFNNIDGLDRNNTFIIGTVKALYPIYGIDTLITAASLVIKRNPDKNILLDIYGKGPGRDEYEELTNTLGIKDKTTFHGYVNNNDLPKVYNNFSVSVSLSNSESFGVVAVEAMSCECPVITSDADGFKEVVADGVTGLIVPKSNPEAAAIAIQKFIDNPGLRMKMGKSGRERVIQLYDWNSCVDKMNHIYDAIKNNHA